MPVAAPMIALHHLAAIVGVATLVAAPAVVLMVPVMVLLQIYTANIHGKVDGGAGVCLITLIHDGRQHVMYRLRACLN
jgi:hypothetical protein